MIVDQERAQEFVEEVARRRAEGRAPAGPVRKGRGPYTFTAPERSHAQRMQALARANEIRTVRADLKRDLASGRVDVVDLLLDPPEWLQTMKLAHLLLAVPKWGRVKVNKTMARKGISASKTIGGLSVRQRREIVANFAGGVERLAALEDEG
jgi:hypothetical protein